MSEVVCTPVAVNSTVKGGKEWSWTVVRKAKDMSKTDFTFRVLRTLGQGTFGSVSKIVTDKNETYALKRLDHDPQYKNREVGIMINLDHVNICKLIYFFREKLKGMDLKINLVLEFMPESLADVICLCRNNKEDISTIHRKVYIYQMLRGLAYLHSKNISHRDMKPQNVLVHHGKGVLKICDLGSAKEMIEGEKSVAYIASRYYRAPELILGNVRYNCSVDTWAAGCVFAEMFLLRPFFRSDSSLGQLTEIIQILGTPTLKQMKKLHNDLPHRLSEINPVPFVRALKGKPDVDAVRLLVKLIQYSPDDRIKCWEALAEPYFDDLRRCNAKFESGQVLPALFDFTVSELAENPLMNQLLVPSSGKSKTPANS